MVLVSRPIEHDCVHPNGFGPISEQLAGGSSVLDPHVLTLGFEVGEIGAKRRKTHQCPSGIVIDDLTLEVL